MGEFTEAVEDFFEASDEPSALSAALTERKAELLHFFKVLSECAEGSMGHSDRVEAMAHTYPKEDALAALHEYMMLLRTHLQTSGTTCSSIARQAETAEGASAGTLIERGQLETTSDSPAQVHDSELGHAPCSNAREAQRPVSPATAAAGSGEAAGESSVGVQQLSMQHTQTDSEVDIVNTPAHQEALRVVLRMPSRFAWTQPPPEPPQDHEHSAETAAAAGGRPQSPAADADAAQQPGGLTESEQLVPDSYPSEAQPELTGEPPAELHHETQYQDAMHDQEMPGLEISPLRGPAEDADMGREEEQMEDDGVGTENQENCSLHSNSQAAAVASQGKKGSQEGSLGEKGSQDRPQQVASPARPEEAEAVGGQHRIMQASGSPSAVLQDSVPLRDCSLSLPEAAAVLTNIGNSAAAAANARAEGDARVPDGKQEPAPEVLTDVEDSFHDAQALSDSDAESEGDSSESDYDSPSWQGSGEDLLFPSEQQSEAARSQLHSQASLCHIHNPPIGVVQYVLLEFSCGGSLALTRIETGEPSEARAARCRDLFCICHWALMTRSAAFQW